jgi:Tol biopolymer transport system component
VAAAATAALIGVAAYATLHQSPPADRSVYRTTILPPAALAGAPVLRLQLSPDGSTLAFAAPDEGGRVVLWVRPLNSATARPLAGTSNAASPFWSPDGRWIAFLADGKLKKIDASGGPVITICDAGLSPAGSWNRDDVILVSAFGGPLARVPAAGGKPEPVLQLRPGSGERVQIAPFFLPDGRHFIFTSGSGGGLSLGVFVGSLDSQEVTKLIDAPTNAVYASGHLIYLLGTSLVAQPFNPDTRVLSGQPEPIADQVLTNPATGTGAFSVSQNGTLVYQSGTVSGTQLVWFDRTGKRLDRVASPGIYRDVQLSPDEAWASVTVSGANAQSSNVWLFDLRRNLSRRFTFGDNAYGAVWTPDGKSLVYATRNGDRRGLYRKAMTGAGGDELLLEDTTEKIPIQVTTDAASLIYETPSGVASGQLYVLPLDGRRQPRRLLEQERSAIPARLSPDRRWLAYVSADTTRREVRVTSFPDGIGRWQISTDGGDNPRWRDDGKELFFTASNKVMAVDVTTRGGTFETGPVRPLFEVRVPAMQLGTRSSYAVTKDGSRFLFNTWDVTEDITPINLVVNWPETLKK